ncbi:OmpA family protein [Lysobacter niastensis]|uniref:OmpA family protein n=1 Tax=Lysobacter niastensis TaxID=380629 RepID=A0ABS0BA44_9GAMM|nr:OmpA family protein [Lysobacter niastensis]MBF6025697.1 OmpA family protein [Lysobacter niastensis]
MLDALIRQAEQLGLGSNARRFIGLLVESIFNPRTGGFAGFGQRFDQAGLGALLKGWVGGTPGDNVLQPDQFSAGFGQQESGRIANLLGVPPAMINLVGAAILPKIIGFLTPGGRIPTSMPAEFTSLLGPAPQARAPEMARPSGMPGWLKWLIPLLIVLGLIFLFRSCRREEPVPTPPPAATETAPQPAPAAQANARFAFENAGGKVAISGQLASDADKKRLMDALTAAFGAGNVSGDVTVDANTLPAGWIDKLISVLPDLKAAGLKFSFDGDKLSIDTSALPEDQRFTITEKLRSVFGGYAITGLWDRATAALAGLKSGFSAGDLVKALNLMNIYFETGSARITADSMEVLQRASEAIKAAPAGTRIEIGGHTDNTGDAASNVTLSQQRADAVAAKLGELGVAGGTLTAKGYGQDKPIADNNTEEGRAKNRRIEFNVMK